MKWFSRNNEDATNSVPPTVESAIIEHLMPQIKQASDEIIKEMRENPEIKAKLAAMAATEYVQDIIIERVWKSYADAMKQAGRYVDDRKERLITETEKIINELKDDPNYESWAAFMTIDS